MTNTTINMSFVEINGIKILVSNAADAEAAIRSHAHGSPSLSTSLLEHGLSDDVDDAEF